MNKLALYVAAVLAVFLLGFGSGWHVKANRTNAAVVRQVVRAARTDAENESHVEKQNDDDAAKIRKLEDDLATARRDAAARGVPKLAQCRRVPEAKADAGPREGAGAAAGPPGGDEAADREVRAYQELRDELLTAAAVTSKLRLQVLACQAQWPTK